MSKENQRPDDKVGNHVFERHTYSGPLGDGYIDYDYKINGADKLMVKADHFGPEARESHGYKEIPDVIEIEKQQSGTVPVLMDVVKMVETTPGSGIFDKRIIVQETYDQPVYSDVQVVRKHPYKAKHFGL